MYSKTNPKESFMSGRVKVAGVINVKSGEFIPTNYQDHVLKSVKYNGVQAKFNTKQKSGSYNLRTPITDVVKNPKYLSYLLMIFPFIKPGTTTVCVKKHNRLTIATKEEIINILDITERQFDDFMREMKKGKIFIRQRFVHKDEYHYEYLLNPFYLNNLNGSICYSDFLIWEPQIKNWFYDGVIEYWETVLSDEYKEECIRAIDPKVTVAHKKRLENFEGYIKPEWIGIN